MTGTDGDAILDAPVAIRLHCSIEREMILSLRSTASGPRAAAAAFLLAASLLATTARADDRGIADALDRGNCQQAGQLINEGMDRNDGDAFFFAGFLYDATGCVKEDPSRAATYYQRAIDLGHPSAADFLARLHGLGRGVPQDYAEAYRLYVFGDKTGTAFRAADPAEATLAGYAMTVARVARDKAVYPMDARRAGTDSTMEAVFDPTNATVSIRSVVAAVAVGSHVAKKQAFIDAVTTAYADALREVPKPTLAKPSTLRFATVWRFGRIPVAKDDLTQNDGIVTLGETKGLRGDL